ncbi:hypothetical protein COLO4_31710 [Corchorus olitorius]|uniref:Uncharacterized protein n=1 Tax=Corchorus olitorius TaxID=93759 RepID=A0A1R3H3E4_9ROSI|nr:hypothetical protein COLO4_31710 [Corchorus olitorius]
MAKFLLFTYLLLLSLLVIPTLAVYLNNFQHDCVMSAGNFTANSTYKANLNRISSQLTSTNSTFGFYNLSAGENPNKINAIALCRGDVDQDECTNCLNETVFELRNRCPFSKEVIGWSDFCTLRYANRVLFGENEDSPGTCLLYPVDAPNADQFNQALGDLFTNLSTQAASGGSLRKYAAGKSRVGSFQTVYLMLQCTPDLSQQECEDCLTKAKDGVGGCCLGKMGCRVLRPSCFFRFESNPFEKNTSVPLPPPPPSPPPPPPPASAGVTFATAGKGQKSWPIVVSVLAPVAGSVLLLVLACCLLKRRAKKKKYDAIQGDNAANDITTIESLQYDFSTIQSATNNFADQNKLGEGGFGEVYKGTLSNGQEIAIKRLSRGSGQGAEEFKNEAVLVAKLQHRNLVRVLGFCLEGEEKILIYEFVPNKSLDYFLFDPAKQGELDWSRRYKIIGGAARGILYLHEDSRFRIIHRDLKASNILLDGDMTPKISDFGLARIFGVDQTQATTRRVVGTYGYMSPEYVMHGQFSVKSDAYSFGVLVLEIVSGKRNSNFYQTDGAKDLISYVWKHWKDGTPLEVLDPTLRDSYSRNEVMRCIQIGLLCVQEDPIDRPTMATIVLMLNSYSVSLPMPNEPAFYLHSRTEGRVPGKGLESDQSTSQSMPRSVNEASITELDPRTDNLKKRSAAMGTNDMSQNLKKKKIKTEDIVRNYRSRVKQIESCLKDPVQAPLNVVKSLRVPRVACGCGGSSQTIWDEEGFEKFGLHPLCVLAIDYFNKKNDTKYKFLKIKKAKYRSSGSGYTYCITFQARQGVLARIYQTRVWKAHSGVEIEPCSCELMKANA